LQNAAEANINYFFYGLVCSGIFSFVTDGWHGTKLTSELNY